MTCSIPVFFLLLNVCDAVAKPNDLDLVVATIFLAWGILCASIYLEVRGFRRGPAGGLIDVDCRWALFTGDTQAVETLGACHNGLVPE